MTSFTNPADIAREALRLLAIRRLAPTPDNYQALYDEISGSTTGQPFPDDLLQGLAAALPRRGPTQWQRARRLEKAVAARDFNECRAALLDIFQAPAEPEPSPAVSPLRELLAYTLDEILAAQLETIPDLVQEARALAKTVRETEDAQTIVDVRDRLKQLAFRLHLVAEDDDRLRAGLLNLLQLMIDNIAELVEDDQWLHGQLELVRGIIDQPLRIRTLEDAERRLKEVIYQQSQVKDQLKEARDGLKSLVSGFITQLANFSENTSDYHDKIETCAVKIRNAHNIAELSAVIDDVMKETHAMHNSVKQSHEELQVARHQAEAAEQRIAALQQELDQTSQMVRHDKLTGTLNRRGLDEILERELAHAERHQSPLCVALLDVDNFKALNDTYGHQAGDQALIHLTTVIRNTLRPVDTVARYGGEEFLVLMPDTPLIEAAGVMTRLQRELTKHFFLHNTERLLITFSAGVAQVHAMEQMESVIARADQAMYQAKNSGKNRVVAAPHTKG